MFLFSHTWIPLLLEEGKVARKLATKYTFLGQNNYVRVIQLDDVCMNYQYKVFTISNIKFHSQVTLVLGPKNNFQQLNSNEWYVKSKGLYLVHLNINKILLPKINELGYTFFFISITTISILRLKFLKKLSIL